MRKLLLLILLWASPLLATSYYIAPAGSGGNDSNNGTAVGTPWLSPNHSVNCGDVLTAVVGTYSAANFASGKWGMVTCAAANNVAWVKCATFDGCKISSGSSDAVHVSANYWGVQGFENTSTTGACFAVSPPSSTTIHHIIFSNDIANSCGSGFTSFNNGNASFDYVAYVGNMAYDAAKSTINCTSGFNVFEPVNSDAEPGTHIFIAGNFAWLNRDSNPCNGGAPTDGDGIIIDTLNGCQTSMPSPYSGQVVVANNMTTNNGGRGILVGGGCANVSNSAAKVYLKYNTAYGNNFDSNQDVPLCGEIMMFGSYFTEWAYNLGITNAALGCGANTIYGLSVSWADATDHVYQSWGYSAVGQNYADYQNDGFSYGPNNTLGTSPSFVASFTPGVPSCGSASSVANCAAPIVAGYTVQNAAAVGYGYQIPATASIYDPLFPQWLCNVNLPVGLVTMGCLTGSASSGSTISGGVIQ